MCVVKQQVKRHKFISLEWILNQVDSLATDNVFFFFCVLQRGGNTDKIPCGKVSIPTSLCLFDLCLWINSIPSSKFLNIMSVGKVCEKYKVYCLLGAVSSAHCLTARSWNDLCTEYVNEVEFKYKINGIWIDVWSFLTQMNGYLSFYSIALVGILMWNNCVLSSTSFQSAI